MKCRSLSKRVRECSMKHYNYVVTDDICEHSECITFEDLFVEDFEEYQFESELMDLLGG